MTPGLAIGVNAAAVVAILPSRNWAATLVAAGLATLGGLRNPHRRVLVGHTRSFLRSRAGLGGLLPSCGLLPAYGTRIPRQVRQRDVQALVVFAQVIGGLANSAGLAGQSGHPGAQALVRMPVTAKSKTVSEPAGPGPADRQTEASGLPAILGKGALSKSMTGCQPMS